MNFERWEDRPLVADARWTTDGVPVQIGRPLKDDSPLAEMIVHGECEWDAWFLDPRRFTGHANVELCALKAIEAAKRDVFQPDWKKVFEADELLQELVPKHKVKFLDVRLNLLRQWHIDGLLCIGDAAHAMSPCHAEPVTRCAWCAPTPGSDTCSPPATDSGGAAFWSFPWQALQAVADTSTTPLMWREASVQPPPASFLESYARAAEDGEAVLTVTVGSALSGTFGSAEAAAFQFDVTTDPAANLASVEAGLARAAEDGVELVVLPEGRAERVELLLSHTGEEIRLDSASASEGSLDQASTARSQSFVGACGRPSR